MSDRMYGEMTKTLREEAPLTFVRLDAGGGLQPGPDRRRVRAHGDPGESSWEAAGRRGGVPPRCAGRDREAEGFHRAELRSAVR